ncbi:hypothetical protein Bca4012_044053 [Brassica carinata]|uniref:TLC domain-containing protein n=4 Tax=Brassica TaxID=3705 RepID=A0A0D3E8J1_BRAOL|nr:unnamed protein product [Brassica napus]VDD31321.1 unnamed protein product [Brassica oleracea]
MRSIERSHGDPIYDIYEDDEIYKEICGDPIYDVYEENDFDNLVRAKIALNLVYAEDFKHNQARAIFVQKQFYEEFGSCKICGWFTKFVVWYFSCGHGHVAEHPASKCMVAWRKYNMTRYSLLGSINYMIFHHCLSGVPVACYLFFGEDQLYTYMVLIFEVTTPEINLRGYYDISGLKQSKAYLINGVAIFLTWFGNRQMIYRYLLAGGIDAYTWLSTGFL